MNRGNLTFHACEKNMHKKNFFIAIFIILMLPCSSISENKRVLKIDNDFLRQHISQVRNPRLMTIQDVKLEYERNWILDRESGCAFIVEGDFNKDGYIDYAVVGKYDGPYQEKSIFVAIFSMRHGKINLDFVYKHKSAHDRAFLCLEPGDIINIENIDKKFDVIVVGFAYGTDYALAIAWDGKRYIDTEFDYIPGKYPRKY